MFNTKDDPGAFLINQDTDPPTQHPNEIDVQNYFVRPGTWSLVIYSTRKNHRHFFPAMDSFLWPVHESRLHVFVAQLAGHIQISVRQSS